MLYWYNSSTLLRWNLSKIISLIHKQLIAGQDYIIPDISCKKKKVAIEYDSAQFHENTERGQRDKRRRDALVKDGWKVFTIVPQQINNAETFDIIAKQILKSLNQGYRIRIKDFEAKRNSAFTFLR